MKTGDALLIAGGGLLAWHFLGLGVAGNTAQIVFQGITATTPLTYTLNFVVQNVSNTQITFNSMSGTVQLNGTGVGNVSAFPNPAINIPGNSQANIGVVLDLSLLGVASDIVAFVQNPGQALNFEVIGNANVNGLVLPFDLKQSVTT